MPDIKEYLRSYIPALRYAELCFRELDEARDVTIRSPKMDGMPHNSTPHGLEVQIAQIDAIRRKAERERDKVLKMRDDIEDRIYALEKSEEKTVIKMRYIYGCEWREIAEEIHVSERTVYRIHGQALAEMRRRENESF